MRAPGRPGLLPSDGRRTGRRPRDLGDLMRQHTKLAALAAVAAAAAVPGAAHGAPSSSNWTCQGAGVQVPGLLSLGSSGSAGSCTTGAGTAVDVPSTAKGAYAETAFTYGDFFGDGNTASAKAGAARVSKGVSPGLVITAKELHSTASTNCRYGTGMLEVTGQGSSVIESLTISGRPVSDGALEAPRVISPAPGVAVLVNQTSVNEGDVVQRALEVRIGGRTVLVAGEAITALGSTEGCFERAPGTEAP